MKGNVSNIQKFSVNDGYGIRTIVFLLGCTLGCQWCQNPEALNLKPELMFIDTLCKSCGRCTGICPDTGPKVSELGEISFDRSKCSDIIRCADICPYEALKVSGRQMTVEQVALEVIKDKVFYKQTGGGLTISGGEPLLQIDFTRELLKRIKQEDIDTCIETAGNVPWTSFQEILPYTDLFLYDLKLLNADLHETWTGARNDQILSNFRLLAKEGKEVIVRIPLIPDINDEKEFRDIVDFVAENSAVRELHILPFHQLGSSKYKQIDRPYSMKDWKEENLEKVEACKTYAEIRGFRVSVGGSGF